MRRRLLFSTSSAFVAVIIAIAALRLSTTWVMRDAAAADADAAVTVGAWLWRALDLFGGPHR